MIRLFAVLALALGAAFATPAVAQQPEAPASGAVRLSPGDEAPRSSTGGAQTLEDILARQRGEKVPDLRRDGAAGQAAALVGQLGVRGLASDSDVWSALRYGTADVTVSTGGAKDAILVQDEGMTWLALRDGPLRTYGGWLMLGMIGVLALFYLLRGKIRIDGGRSGVTIQRFNSAERFGHWMLGGSFILLGVTGLAVLFGRLLIPWIGHEAFSVIALGSKWIHNNVSWAFMLGLLIVIPFWIVHNIPSRIDFVWFAKAGGLFSRNVHPPARKFNAGQKVIFWSVAIFGIGISATGVSLLFPFELQVFAPTFEFLNSIGFASVWGEPLPTQLTPHQEMQLASLWHAILAFILMAIVIAHIYLGSVGMEGAFDAMGSGQVDLQWAKEHHGLWVQEEEAKAAKAAGGSGPSATPAE